MKKEDVLGGGYKVIIKGKEYPERVCLMPDDPRELQTFLDVISEKHEPPLNKTKILAQMRIKGYQPVRFHVDVGVQMLIDLKLINDIEKNFFGYTIQPNYSKAKVKTGVVYFD